MNISNDILEVKTAVSTWLNRGLSFYYLSFLVSETDMQHCSMMLDYIGFELFCKSYILAIKSEEFNGKPFQEAKEIINGIAKKYGHNINKMLKLISQHMENDEIDNQLNAIYNSFGKSKLKVTGKDLIEVLKASFFEVRYPLPDEIYSKFPLNDEGYFWDPICSDLPIRTAHNISKKMVLALISKYNIGFNKKDIKLYLEKKSGKRFCNVFFQKDIDKYIL